MAFRASSLTGRSAELRTLFKACLARRQVGKIKGRGVPARRLRWGKLQRGEELFKGRADSLQILKPQPCREPSVCSRSSFCMSEEAVDDLGVLTQSAKARAGPMSEQIPRQRPGEDLHRVQRHFRYFEPAQAFPCMVFSEEEKCWHHGAGCSRR